MSRRRIPLILSVMLPILGLVWVYDTYPPQKPQVQTSQVFLAPPSSLKLMTFGFHEIFASSLWLRWLQDLEICGKPTMTRAEYEHQLSSQAGKKTDVLDPAVKEETDPMDASVFLINKDEKVCEKGWSFQLLDAITELTPKFRPPYSQGATALSVLANDYAGAKIIFDKGILNYPNDWLILYRAAYHYLYEVRDFDTAADLLKHAAEMGGPPWLSSLASRLYSRTGQASLGYATLLGYYKTLEDPERKRQVEKRLKKLQAYISRSNK